LRMPRALEERPIPGLDRISASCTAGVSRIPMVTSGRPCGWMPRLWRKRNRGPPQLTP